MHDHDHAHGRAERWQGLVQAAILAGLGLYFAWNIASGNLANYINARFAWLSYLAAGLFLLLALARARRLRDDGGHAHGTGWLALAIVALPLALGVLVPSRPLGADAIDGSLSSAAVGSVSELSLSVPPEQRNVLDWARAFHIAGDPTALDGLPLDAVGFVYRAPGDAPGRFLLARFTISCCVADSAAVAIPVVWDGADALRPDTWVRVSGRIVLETVDGGRAPVARAAAVETVPQPDHPYLYP